MAGSWVQVPPGIPHTFAFTGSEQAAFLNLHTPSCGYGAFLRGLLEALTTGAGRGGASAFDLEARVARSTRPRRAASCVCDQRLRPARVPQSRR